MFCIFVCFFDLFFFKQKTAYEMRISDWSSDVCSSDLDALQLNLESWEGPLDLLLTLARGQKVDLRQISILALVEQYLTFIAEMRALKLEVAADYLVMAAWHAYLQSALLLDRKSVVWGKRV